MNLTALIVDDELKSGKNIATLLEKYCSNVEVIGIAQKVKDAYQLINEFSPQVVFLDVRMQNETGFDLLEMFDKINFEVVFTTAYSEYAIKAFKFSAIDYLLKPIDIDELQFAVEKTKEKFKSDSFSTERIEFLLSSLKAKSTSTNKIAIPDSNGLTFIKLSDILYCEGQNNYTIFFINDGRKLMVSKTLMDYEKMLSEYNFFRIHKSYLINLNEIKEYIKGDGGYVIMKNNANLDVSKRKKEPFLTKISSL